jgi:hypothetical protein
MTALARESVWFLEHYHHETIGPRVMDKPSPVLRYVLALIVMLTAVFTGLLLSATPGFAQENPDTTEQAPAPSPEPQQSSQQIGRAHV